MTDFNLSRNASSASSSASAAPLPAAPVGAPAGAPASPAAPARPAFALPVVGSDVTVPSNAVFPILKDNILVDGFHVVIDLERSHGSTIVDALEGKEYLDCYSYFATQPLGHNHPGMNDAAFQATLLRAALANPANSDMYTREFAAFVATFRRLAVKEPFRYLFFIAGGALAVENAMKAAFDWKAQRNRARGVGGGADKILHFSQAFHGRSGYTLSVTNTEPEKTRDFPQFSWPRISNPKLSFPLDDAAITTVAAAEQRAVFEIEAAFAADPRGIAAILLEPIQGEGGDNHFRPEFLAKLRGLADLHAALLIFDEVQTGVGATGTMWAYEQLGTTPDLLVFGKKTQVCGIMSTTRIDSAEKNVFHVSSRINSTWGGSLVDMVRCARYLQIMEQEQLVANAARTGKLFLDGLRELSAKVPAMSNARGRGLMLAFDLPDREQRNAARSKFWDAGLATLACGQRSIRFRPALVFSPADVARALEILRRVLS